MSWIRGQANDYKDMSDILHAAATGDSVSAPIINAAGTAYTVGDLLTVVGGTFSEVAVVEVVTITGGGGTGPVGTMRMYNYGIYTATPSVTANAVTGGTGSSATVDLTYASNGWTSLRNQQTSISSVDSVAAGGTGYIVGEIITLTGGIFGTVATLTVATLSGSAVASVTISDAGVYSVLPTDPVAQGSTDESGSGATFNLTWEAGEKDVILEGEGSGSDEIFVGWRTLSGAGYFNFELHAFDGFDSALAHSDQLGVSPGQWDHVTVSLQDGAYMLCGNSPFNYWLKINSYNMTLVVNVSGANFPLYLGYGDRFGTVTEYPYPVIVSGSTSYAITPSNESKAMSGLTDPWTASESDTAGPMFVKMLDNTWKTVSNGTMAGTLGAPVTDAVAVSPTYQPQGILLSNPPEDHFFDSQLEWNDIIENEATGTPDFNVDPIPGTTDQQILIPCTLISTTPSENVLVALDGIFWTTAFTPGGLLNSGDRIVDGIDTYRIFSNCNRSSSHAFFAIKEE